MLRALRESQSSPCKAFICDCAAVELCIFALLYNLFCSCVFLKKSRFDLRLFNGEVGQIRIGSCKLSGQSFKCSRLLMLQVGSIYSKKQQVGTYLYTIILTIIIIIIWARYFGATLKAERLQDTQIQYSQKRWQVKVKVKGLHFAVPRYQVYSFILENYFSSVVNHGQALPDSLVQGFSTFQ